MSVYKKLMEARIKLQKTDLKKTGLNKFSNYLYFELGDFLPATQQILAELGLCGVVSYAVDVATLTITDVDGGGVITITSPMSEANLKGCHPIQNLGAVETYTRRYLWVTAMEIVEHDALDAATGKDEQKVVKSVPADHWGVLSEPDKRRLQGVADTVRASLDAGDMETVMVALSEVTEVEEKTALWSRFSSAERAVIKKYSQSLEGK